MRVRAIETGFDNLAIRNPGDEFDMPDGSEAAWFEPVEVETKKKAKKEEPLV